MPFFCPTFVYRDMFQGVKLQNKFRLAMLRKLKKRVFRQIDVLRGQLSGAAMLHFY